jgi:uncharacterized membrane protein YcaP (DUF421 family)
MESILRAATVYVVLLVIFRIAGKRSLGDITTFDAVLLLIVSEAIQQALIDNDTSMVNAFLIVVTLIGLSIAASFVTLRSTRADKVLNDVPLLLIEDFRLQHERMAKTRITPDDILERARELWGVERLDQVRWAVLERGGHISVIPAGLPWSRGGDAATGRRESAQAAEA